MNPGPKNVGRFALLLAVLLAGGCSYTGPTAKVRTPFVPPPPRPVSTALLPDAPAIAAANTVVEITPDLRSFLQLSDAQRASATAIQRAYLRFQRGKGLYQANDMGNARVEFNAAMDLMLYASEQDPGDRQEFGRKLDDLVDAIHHYDLAGLGASESSELGRFENPPLEDILQMTFPVDPRLKTKVREQVAATASQLPLTVNDAVLGYINFFSNRGHRTIVAAIERAGRYRPMIQRILDEEGLPQELIHLAQAESGFYARAMSSMSAGGMWQFVKFRGNEYGLKQTPYTDDRMDPEKATRAAAHHLHDLYSEFGDWYLALAAYNCGPMVVEKAVERTGYADFWQLRSRGVLPAETTNYVPIILAMTIMEKNAAEYGLEGITPDPPLEYDTMEMTAKTSLALVSDILDSSVPELSELNPSILKTTVPADYPLHVPKGAGPQLMAGLELIPADHRDAWRIHRMGIGESLADVGKRFGISLTSLVSVNNLPAPEASEGDRLIIPAAARVEPALKKPVAATVRRASASTTKPKTPARAVPKPTLKAKPKTPPKSPVTVATAKMQ